MIFGYRIASVSQDSSNYEVNNKIHLVPERILKAYE